MSFSSSPLSSFHFHQVIFLHWIFGMQIVILKEVVFQAQRDLISLYWSNRSSVFFREPYEGQWWNIRWWLAVAQPEGSNESSINRSSWSHSMEWRDHETWQMHLQLLMGTEHPHPSLGHMKDPFQRWQDTVKLPFSLLFKKICHIFVTADPEPQVHRTGDRMSTSFIANIFPLKRNSCTFRRQALGCT